MIKELMFEGSNRYFDQALCTGLTITDEDIDALCKAMKEQAVKNAHNEEQKASIKDVGRQQLRSWGGLIERDSRSYSKIAEDYCRKSDRNAGTVCREAWISKRTISRIFAELKEQGILEQQGNRRKAKWLIIKKR